jgi:hypothetical protein
VLAAAREARAVSVAVPNCVPLPAVSAGNGTQFARFAWTTDHAGSRTSPTQPQLTLAHYDRQALGSSTTWRGSGTICSPGTGLVLHHATR